MAYTLTYSLALGPAYAAIADLRAQLVNTSGANVGSAISTGFVNIGTGYHMWTYASIPDDHSGGVKFYSAAAPSVVLAFLSINPQEAEYTDVKTSTRGTGTSTLTAAQVDTQLSGTHGAGSWATATGFATPTNVSDAQAAIEAAIAALNNLSTAQSQSAAAAAITAAGLPNAAAIVAAVMAEIVTGAKTVEDVLRNLWSVNVGDSAANDADDPTSVAYKDADGDTDVTHTLTDTERTGA